MRYVLLVFSICFAAQMLSANFSYKAAIAPVEKDGVYSIALPPELLMRLRDDYGDIRVFDSTETEIPYIIYREEAISRSNLFHDYHIIRNSTEKDKTVLILENALKKPISNVCIVIRNSDVRKTAELSGSDDAQTWYAIRNNYVFESIYSDTHTAETMQISFPLSDYRYLRLEINDKKSSPLNIIQAGYYDLQSEEGKYTEISGGAFSQRLSEKNKNTLATIEFTQPVRIDKIILAGDMQVFFRRNVSISVVSDARQYAPITYQVQNVLTSSEETVITTFPLKVKRLEAEVMNGNDTPLMLSKVKLYQLNTYIVMNLKKNTAYSVFFGDPGKVQPVYDIVHKKDELLKSAVPGNLHAVIELPKKTPGFFGSAYFLWITLIVVGGLLGYFSVTMIKDMKKKE